jgi:hypothetical protein
MRGLRLLVVSAFVLPALALAAGLTVNTRVNGVVGGAIAPRSLSNLELAYVDSTGRTVSSFVTNHEKKNHVILVSESLESFAHIHPELLRSGVFAIRLGDQPSSYDADNQDAARAIPKGGNYFLFTEVQPQGAREPELVVTGLAAVPAERPAPLVLDPVGPRGVIVKFFKADLQPGVNGDAYRVTLVVQRAQAGIRFNFRFEERGSTGAYAPLDRLEDWLGMPGHGILVSQDPAEGSRVFRHMHFGMHGGGHGGGHGPAPTGAAVDFTLEGDDVPALSGVYKIWSQVKHRGRVLTFPVVIRL